MARGQIRVLVADAFDECEMYAEALRVYGLTVTTASSVSEARSAVQRRRFDVVVQGSVFGDGSGVDLTTAVRRSRRLTRTPLIVLTGFTDEPRLASLRQSGCDAILIKPCLPNRLLNEILRLLKRHVARNVARRMH